MALKKSEKRLLGILGIAVIIFLLDQFVFSAGKKGQTVVQAKTSKAKPKVTAVRSFSERGAKHFESWGRDPFAINTAASGSTPTYELNPESRPKPPELKGMFWKDGKSHVIINDVILGEGEEQAGLKIHSIKGTEVLCSQGSRMYTLHWRESP